MPSSLAERLLVEPGSKLKLKKHDPDETFGLSRDRAEARTADNLDKLHDLQYVLNAENKRSVLVVLQAMDAGGKDGTIRKIFTGMNPQGCHVTSFKAPTEEELEHDFLWRVHRVTPRRGDIGIFNRSHYEDVLIVRVKNLAPKQIWSKRYEQINEFERLLAESGTTILKFFLNISKEEQKRRLEERMADPAKHWKFNAADWRERRYWEDYMEAYEEALTRCSTGHAPWHIIPANNKWFRDYAISEILADTLKAMKLKFPKVVVEMPEGEHE